MALPPLQIQAPRREGGNRFCGPAVVSALTGVTTDEAARVIRQVTGRRSVTGTHEWELTKALKLFNLALSFDWAGGGKCPTLARWAEGPRDWGAVYLVSAGRHWQLVQGSRFTCGRVGEVTTVDDPRIRHRARVRVTWKVVRTGPPVRPPCTTRKPPDPLRAKCLRLAKRLGCTVQYDRQGELWWVDGPEEVYGWIPGGNRPDPRDGNHACVGWGEVWEALEEYHDDLALHRAGN